MARVITVRDDLGYVSIRDWHKDGSSVQTTNLSVKEAQALAAALAAHLGLRLVPADAEVAPEGYVATEYVSATTRLERACDWDADAEPKGWVYYRSADRSDEPLDEEGYRAFPVWRSLKPLLGWPTAQAAADAVAALQEGAEP